MLTIIDWIVIIVYILLLLYLGYRLGSKQSTTEEYFVGARSLTWPIIGISAMATQLGSISFISAPGFVGMMQGGGLLWLSYEFALPIAMLILIMVVYPVFYNAKIVTIYEYLNIRFDPTIRLAISLVFQISRVLATGISIYATAIVFESAFNIPNIVTLVIVSIVTIIYATMGGIKAVIYADVIQMIIIFCGIFVCAFIGLDLLGGWNVFVNNVDPSRLTAIDFKSLGIHGSKDEFGFWPFLLGGLFLYLSYYGCDQTQSQRLISSKDSRHLNLSLVFNGLARFPLVLSYCIMGLIVGTFAFTTPEFLEAIPRTADNMLKSDYMLPIFIVKYLPVGVVGLLIVAILSAAMSSVSGTLNSLSAAAMKDIVIPYFKKDMEDKEAYKWSILFTLFWGILCTIIALFADKLGQNAIVAINKVGSAFYGSVLAVFILGMVTKRTNAAGATIGLIIGVAFNLYMWIFMPDISWLWWNIIGFTLTFVLGYLTSLFVGKKEEVIDENLLTTRNKLLQPNLKTYTIILLTYFIIIMLLSHFLRYIL